MNTGPGFVHSGDAVKKYHWLVNVDDTGDPGTSAAPGIDRCLPSTAKGGSTDPDYADTCAWPSTRNTSGFAPIVAQGDETDLDDTTALDNLPAGKYLISVTADGFKIDGSHFTVTGRDPEGGRRDEPHAAAADDAAAHRSSTTTHRSTRRTRWTRSRGCAASPRT